MILPYRSHPKELYKGQVSDHEDIHCPELSRGLHTASTLLMVCKECPLQKLLTAKNSF